MKEGEKWDELPDDIVYAMCALVKHNSIEGCKKEVVNVVYTPCTNLKKTADMAAGQVSFHKKKCKFHPLSIFKVAIFLFLTRFLVVKKWKNVPKEKEIVKKLYKTKKEEFPDLAKLRQAKELEIIKKNKEIARIQREADAQQQEEWQAEKNKWDEAVYDFMDEEQMTSNTEGTDFDDFM